MLKKIFCRTKEENAMDLKDIEPLAMGERIRQYREKNGMTREQLAERMEVTPRFIADVEYGSKGISLRNFTALVQILGVPADYILFGIENPGDNGIVCETKLDLD